jgi:2-dehydropantoate 2-reductase
LPVINGMSHIDRLAARFGGDRVLGGMAVINATLDPEGHIVQFVPAHDLVYGERTGGFSDRMLPTRPAACVRPPCEIGTDTRRRIH